MHSDDLLLAMGATLGAGSGISLAAKEKTISVIGDSTFWHSGLTELVNSVYNNANITVVVVDNSTTAMTGFQNHPGLQTSGENQTPVSIKKIVEAIKPDLFEVVDATDIDETLNILHNAVNTQGLKVLLVNSICRLEKHAREQDLGTSVYVDETICIGEECKICVAEFACPALEWNSDKNIAAVLENECIHCGACLMVCPHDAIKKEE